MPELELEEIPEYKLYSPLNVRIAAFFGGVPIATYMIAQNFMALGYRREAKTTWIIGMSALIVIVASQLIPLLNMAPPIVFPIIIAVTAGQTAKSLQGPLIEEHMEKGGEIYSAGHVALVTLLGLGITVALALAISFIRESMFGYH